MKQLVTVIFLGLIFAPLAALLLGAPAIELENRALLDRPAIEPVDLLDPDYFAGERTPYLRDHLRLRDLGLDIHGRISVFAFRESPSPRVIPARDGFLFYDQEIDRGCAFAIEPAQVIENLEAWGRYFRDRGGAFLFVLVPDKAMIYRDTLRPPEAERYACVNAKDEALLGLFDTLENVDVINLTPVMTELRRQEAQPVYFRTDTHWNWRHSALLPERIVEQLAPGLWDAANLSREDGRFQTDLAFMAGIRQFEDVVFWSATRPGVTSREDEAVDAPVYRRVRSSSEGAQLIGGRTLVVSDSFFAKSIGALDPYFEDVSLVENTVFIRSEGHALLAEADTLVVEFVTRNIWEHAEDFINMEQLDAVKAVTAAN